MTIYHIPIADASQTKELSEGEVNEASFEVTRCFTPSIGHSTHMTTILDLPPVVLEEIVALVLGDMCGKDRLNTLLGISYISRYMYSIIHGALRLWAFVDTKFTADVNEHLIRKSGSAPLTIVFRLNMKRSFNEWEVLTRERSRWKELKIMRWESEDCTSGWSSCAYSEGLRGLKLVSHLHAEDGTKYISISGIDPIQSLDMEDIEMPIEQLRILSVQLIHLRLRIHRQESENFLPLRDLLESCPNIQTLSLTAGTDELGYFPDLSSISPITFHHLRTLHLMQFGVWATLQLLISIRSPVLTMIEAEADLARGRHRGIKDLSWISEKTATDSALSIFLSQFDKLSFESDYQSVYFCVGSSKTQQWKTLGVNDNTAALLEVLHNYMDVSNVRLGGRDTLSHMPRILDCFGSLQRLTLVHGGRIDEILLRMGTYNSSSNTWCLPQLQWLTIQDCHLQPHALQQFVRARYSRSTSASTQPTPLLYLQVFQYYDPFPLRIIPEIMQEVRSILGKDKVEWVIEGVADSSDVVDEGDSEIESEDEGKTQPWRRHSKESAWGDCGGAVEVPFRFSRRCY